MEGLQFPLAQKLLSVCQGRKCRAGKIRLPCLRIFALAAPLIWNTLPPVGNKSALTSFKFLLQSPTAPGCFLCLFSSPETSLRCHYCTNSMYTPRKEKLRNYHFTSVAPAVCLCTYKFSELKTTITPIFQHLLGARSCQVPSCELISQSEVPFLCNCLGVGPWCCTWFSSCRSPSHKSHILLF